MFPKLFFLPTYGILFATGVVAGWWWFLRRARTFGISEELLFNLSFYTLLGGILGAKLSLILLDWRTYLAHPAELLGTLRTAGVLIGGIIAGALVFLIYSRRHALPTWELGDALAAPLALGQGLGRLGCLAAGCCWGVPAGPACPFPVTFTDPQALARPLGIPLVPTQLFQAANDLLLAGLLTWLWRRRPAPPGTVFWTYAWLYSLTRGIIEFWRGDVERGLFFGDRVSTSQLLSLAGIVLASGALLRGRIGAHRSRMPVADGR